MFLCGYTLIKWFLLGNKMLCCCDIENLQTICYIIKRATVNFYCPSELLSSLSVLYSIISAKIQIPTFIHFLIFWNKWQDIVLCGHNRFPKRQWWQSIWYVSMSDSFFENMYKIQVENSEIEIVTFPFDSIPIKGTIKFNAKIVFYFPWHNVRR